jgi:uncharacterized phiE125 gp8 family phage protein
MTTTFVQPPWTTPAGVSSVLVEAPTWEPLTLDEAKLRAGLDWVPGDPRDALMTDFIRAARMQVEQDTGLALPMQTRDVTIAATIGSPAPLPWQAMPVQSMTDPAGRRVDPARYASLTDFWGSEWVQAFPGGTWRIVAGWPTADALRAEVPLLLHAVGLLTAHYATLGRDLVLAGHILPSVPMGYAEMVAAYTLVTLP